MSTSLNNGDSIAAPKSTEQPEQPSSNHGSAAYKTITEGLATILVPETKEDTSKPGSDSGDQSVFYNPIQQFNRDLSVLAIKAFGEETIDAKRQKWEKRRADLARKNERLKRKRKRGDEDGQATEVIGQQQHQQPEEGADSVGDTLMQNTDEVTPSQEGPSEANAAPKADPTPTYPMPPFRILDALSATGLRAIRYAKEIPWVTSVTANDLSSEATRSIRTNVEHNDVGKKVEITCGNAMGHMYSVLSSRSRKYDVIDLDPYGTAASFFDAAVQALNDGGLLCATCTDPGVWASVGYPEKCFALYGGVPIKGSHSHEAGLRIILHAIATSAARYGLAIEPLLSLSIDYYARVFVRVRRSPAEVKFLAGKTMLVYNCDQGCGAWTTQLLAKHKEMEDKKGGSYFKHSLALAPSSPEFCQHCGFKTHLAGPMYAGPIHSNAFIQRILSSLPQTNNQTYPTTPRIKGMLTTALEEDLFPSSSTTTETHTRVDLHPFFILPTQLAKVLHCITPTEAAIRGAFKHLGYRVSRSHTKPGSVKTDAPWSIIWKVMREWVRQRAPVKEGKLKEGMAGWRILYGGVGGGGGGGDNDGKKGDDDGGDGSSSSNKEAVVVVANGGDDGKGEVEVMFDEKLGAHTSKKNKDKDLVRYQLNPTANWGPMNRARGGGGGQGGKKEG